MDKNIRSKVVKESLLDYNTLAKSLEENSRSAIKSLLGEAVRDTYAKLLSEDDDKDYEEGEVEDTSSDANAIDAESSEEPTDVVGDTDTSMEQPVDDTAVEGGEDVDVEGGDEGEEWADFDKYKVSDDEYDFSNAEDDEIVKVYKLMKNDDQILVNKDDNGNVSIQDNETGAEYLINLGGGNETSEVEVADEGTDDFGEEADLENNDVDMNESTEKMFELVLEYNSNVGYTDNYQKKDVMTTDGMSEPGKNVNDWDAGVPKGTSKPWSGYPSKKNKADKPFNAEKGKQVEEQVDECGDAAATEAPMEEQTNVGGYVQQNSVTQTHTSTSNGRNARSMSKGGKRVKGTATPRYSNGGEGNDVQENFIKRANKVLAENKELKNTLTVVMEELKNAAVTNKNLAQIVRLISENSTTQDEKHEIIERFSKEAKTIEQSDSLYESISRDLKKKDKMNITEEKTLEADNLKKVNETTIYKSPDMMESLDLMHRIMKS